MPLSTRAARGRGYTRVMMPTSRLRERGATCGVDAPMRKAITSSVEVGAGEKASHAISARSPLLTRPAISTTGR